MEDAPEETTGTEGLDEVNSPTELDEASILGDVNADGEVDIFDLVRLRKYLAGVDVALNESAADVNEDNEIDIFDLVRLRKSLAGIL